VAEVIRGIIEKLRDKAIGSGVAGLTLVLGDVAYENVALIHKSLGNLRQAKDAVIPTAFGVIGLALNLVGAEDSLAVGVAKALKGVFDALIFKKPFAFAKDAKTIEVFGLDPNEDVQVIIDGSAVSFTTPPTTDSNGHVVIELPTELSAGKHELIVRTSKKAFYGAIAV
jgi:hypothetical protein